MNKWCLIFWFDREIVTSSTKRKLVYRLDLGLTIRKKISGWYEVGFGGMTIVKKELLDKVMKLNEGVIEDFKISKI